MKTKTFAIFMLVLFLSGSTVHAQWANNQNASQVVGQSGYTSNGDGNSYTYLGPIRAIAIDAVTGKAYVASSHNNVLRFIYPFSGAPPTAEMDFGLYNNGGPSQTLLGQILSTAVYNNILYVADAQSNRILRFNSASTATAGSAASGLIGQTDYAVGTLVAASNKTLNNPQDISIDGSGNLWVADCGNNRVLKFTNVNGKPTDGTATADLVLGQSDMVTGTAGAVSSTSLSGPTGVCVSGTTLWVVDKGYNRVLRYDNPSSYGFAATMVLGQSNLTSNTVPGTVSQSQFKSPSGAAIDGNGNLYVSESEDNRVMIFLSAASKGNGGSADNVLGQSDWTSSTLHLSQNGFSSPRGMAIDNTNKKLFVADYNNCRGLGFLATSALPVELSSFTAAASKGNVDLAWSTATEVNNAGFQIEKLQAKSEKWESIGFVDGHGTTNAPQSYSFTDKPGSGKFQYRLKQTDRDGKFEYSKTIEAEVAAPVKFGLEQNYPNPFNPTTNISFTIPVTGHARLTVFNILGAQICELFNGVVKGGEKQTAAFDAAAYASGIYFYRFESAGTVTVKKMQLIR